MREIIRALFSVLILVVLALLIIEVVFAFKHGYWLRLDDILNIILRK